MHRFEQYELTDADGYRGDIYYLTGFVAPRSDHSRQYDPDEDADTWGASVARRIVYTDEVGEVVHTDNEEIVCIDTRHGKPHIDYEFLPRGHEGRKEWLDGEWPYSKMKRFLAANWKKYVDEAAERG